MDGFSFHRAILCRNAEDAELRQSGEPGTVWTGVNPSAETRKLGTVYHSLTDHCQR